MGMGLKAHPREVSDIVILDLNGRITLDEGCQNVGELIQELLAKDRKKILLNLAEVNFIDSAGIGTLTKCFVAAKRNGGAIKLLHLTTKIRDLLQITNLYTIFEVFSDEQSAISSFQ
jgi:anti-sigma B factor antagonist